MSTVLLSATDPRGPKAVALAADAGQWLKCRTKDGRKAYGVPSSEPGRYYLTTRQFCTCPAFEFKGSCKHQIAVQLHCELVAEQTGRKVARTAHGICAVCGGETEHDLDTHVYTDRRQRGVIPAHLIERED